MATHLKLFKDVGHSMVLVSIANREVRMPAPVSMEDVKRAIGIHHNRKVYKAQDGRFIYCKVGRSNTVFSIEAI